MIRKSVITILFTISVPFFVYGGNIDDIVKQQKNKAAIEVEGKNREERNKAAMNKCREEVTKIVASQIKELMDKGVKFKKDPGVFTYKDIGGQRYANDGETNCLIITSMFEDRLIVKSCFGTYIDFQPENGAEVSLSLSFYENGTSDIEPLGLFKYRSTLKLRSYYDTNELKIKEGKLSKIITEAVKAAIAYGDK